MANVSSVQQPYDRVTIMFSQRLEDLNMLNTRSCDSSAVLTTSCSREVRAFQLLMEYRINIRVRFSWTLYATHNVYMYTLWGACVHVHIRTTMCAHTLKQKCTIIHTNKCTRTITSPMKRKFRWNTYKVRCLCTILNVNISTWDLLLNLDWPSRETQCYSVKFCKRPSSQSKHTWILCYLLEMVFL